MDKREYNRDYIYGSAAPAYMPETRPERRESRPQRRALQDTRTKQLLKKRRDALSMDLPYLVMLTLASIAALVILCSFLKVQSSMAAHIKTIETQEAQLEALRSENDALETRINTYANLDHVYQVASEELGMVYADRHHIITYDKTESEYVRQYDDIPKQ